MMVYTTGKIGVDLLTDASDSRSSHRGCLRSAPGPPVKNGLGWWELHKMLGYRYCNFNSKIGLLDVENHLQVVGSFVFLWCFWYQIHSKSILQPHVIHGFHGQNCPESYGFFADWHCGTVALRHQPRWSTLGEILTPVTFKTTLKMAGFLQVSTWPNGRSSDFCHVMIITY